jgi:hypothetical protein
MKKTLSVVILICLFSSPSFAQNFKPSFQTMVKSSVILPVGDNGFNSSYHTAPGAQFEITYNIKPLLALFGNFTFDILAPVQSTGLQIGATNRFTSHQYSGSAGVRLYFTEKNTPRFFTDIGLGYYSFSQGDIEHENEVPGDKFSITTYSAYQQIGANLGTGANITFNKNIFLNLAIKYNFVFERPNASLTGTTFFYDDNSTQVKTYTFRAETRSYFQFAAGIGYSF